MRSAPSRPSQKQDNGAWLAAHRAPPSAAAGSSSRNAAEFHRGDAHGCRAPCRRTSARTSRRPVSAAATWTCLTAIHSGCRHPPLPQWRRGARPAGRVRPGAAPQRAQDEHVPVERQPRTHRAVGSASKFASVASMPSSGHSGWKERMRSRAGRGIPVRSGGRRSTAMRSQPRRAVPADPGSRRRRRPVAMRTPDAWRQRPARRCRPRLPGRDRRVDLQRVEQPARSATTASKTVAAVGLVAASMPALIHGQHAMAACGEFARHRRPGRCVAGQPVQQHKRTAGARPLQYVEPHGIGRRRLDPPLVQRRQPTMFGSRQVTHETNAPFLVIWLLPGLSRARRHAVRQHDTTRFVIDFAPAIKIGR